MTMKKAARAGSPIAVLLLLAGCASGPVTVAPKPPASYQSLGTVEGSGCGSLGVLATAYYAIPMGLNGRVKSAYDDALSKAPGATSLINVTIQEDWYWWLLGTARCVKVTGEAIK